MKEDEVADIKRLSLERSSSLQTAVDNYLLRVKYKINLVGQLVGQRKLFRQLAGQLSTQIHDSVNSTICWSASKNFFKVSNITLLFF